MSSDGNAQFSYKMSYQEETYVLIFYLIKKSNGNMMESLAGLVDTTVLDMVNCRESFMNYVSEVLFDEDDIQMEFLGNCAYVAIYSNDNIMSKLAKDLVENIMSDFYQDIRTVLDRMEITEDIDAVLDK